MAILLAGTHSSRGSPTLGRDKKLSGTGKGKMVPWGRKAPCARFAGVSAQIPEPFDKPPPQIKVGSLQQRQLNPLFRPHFPPQRPPTRNSYVCEKIKKTQEEEGGGRVQTLTAPNPRPTPVHAPPDNEIQHSRGPEKKPLPQVGTALPSLILRFGLGLDLSKSG